MPIAIKHVTSTVSAATTLYTVPAGRTAKVTLSSFLFTTGTGGSHTMTAAGVMTYSSSGTTSAASQSSSTVVSPFKSTMVSEFMGPGQTFAVTPGTGATATTNLSIVEEIAS